MFHVKHRKDKIMELKDTVDMMLSDDYKERFKAEYYQTKIRYDKLFNMVAKLKSGTLDFKPTCGVELFEKQLECMQLYICALAMRANIENITL